MNAGRLSKRSINVALTANLIKRHLGLALTVDEQALEAKLKRRGKSECRMKQRRSGFA